MASCKISLLLLGLLSQQQIRLLPQQLPKILIFHQLSIEEILVQEARFHEIPIHLVLNTAWRESKFKPYDLSSTKDYGVMQLSQRYYPDVQQITIRENICRGTSLLAKYWQICHNERLTYRAYNEGPRILKGER